MATFAEAPPGNEKSGEKIFRTKCAQCHTVDKGAGHKQGKNHIFFINHLSLMMKLCWISFSIAHLFFIFLFSSWIFLLRVFLWLFVEKMRISVVFVSISLRMAVFWLRIELFMSIWSKSVFVLVGSGSFRIGFPSIHLILVFIVMNLLDLLLFCS